MKNFENETLLTFSPQTLKLSKLFSKILKEHRIEYKMSNENGWRKIIK
jgi:hypothetical protein